MRERRSTDLGGETSRKQRQPARAAMITRR
jgi:hypothetical protein